MYKDESPRRYAWRDNQSALVSIDFDPEILAADLAAGVDFSGIFTDEEQTEILDGFGKEPPEEKELPDLSKAEELQEIWQVKSGDVWALGKHRVACGNCTDRVVVEAVMEGGRADCLIADPPYGMNLDASYSNSIDNFRKNVKRSRGYKNVIGDSNPFNPTPLFVLFSSIPEQFYWGADYYRDKLPAGGSWLVWDKRTSVEGVNYSSSEFELCWSKKQHHRIILRVPWFGIIGTEQQDIQTRLHPTQKPLGVITPLIEKYGNTLIFDPFLGSGTTLIAAHHLNRICYGCELDPSYVAVCLQRYLDLTGDQPPLIP